MNDQNLPAVVEETTTQTLTESLELNPTEFDEIISSIATPRHTTSQNGRRGLMPRISNPESRRNRRADGGRLQLAEIGIRRRRSPLHQPVRRRKGIPVRDADRPCRQVPGSQIATRPDGPYYLPRESERQEVSYEDFKGRSTCTAKPKSDDDKSQATAKK